MALKWGKDNVARLLLSLQIPLIFVATVLLAIIGWRIGPLLEEYQSPKISVGQLSKDATARKQKIEDLDSQIAAKKAALDQLASAVDKSGDKALKSAAKQIVANAPLQGFKIGIYFRSDDESLAKRAADLAGRLKKDGVPAQVQLYPEDRQYLEKFPKPEADEVRYESPIEDEQGHTLLEDLKVADPDQKYRPRIVTTRTPNFITIWFKSAQP